MKLKNNKDGIANNLDIVIGDRNVMEDFWKPLIDKKVGDVVEFVVNYPKGLKDKNLAGKKIEYSATIKKISRSAEYELNDEFAKSLGYEDFKKLHAWAEARAKAHYEQLSKSVMKRDLLEKMSEMYTFEVPDNMFNVEYKEVHRQLTAEANKLGKKMSERAEEECKKIAESRVRLGFVVAEVSRENKITVSKEEIAAEIRNIAAMYPGHEKAIWDMYSRGAALNAIIGPVLERKVVDYLFGIIKIKEKKCSAKELVDLDEETFDFFKESAESSNEKPKKTVEKAEKTEKGEKKEIKKSEKKESTTEKKVKAESKTEKKAAVKKKATKSK
jgi:trigger factor